MTGSLSLLLMVAGGMAVGLYCGWFVATLRAETRIRRAIVSRCILAGEDCYMLVPINEFVQSRWEGRD